LEQPQLKKLNMQGKRMPSQFDQEKIKKNIALILDKVKTEADPQLLNKYRSLFKGEVSLFRRSWTAAYLLMLYDQGVLNRPEKHRGRKSGGPDRKPDKQGRQDRRVAEKAPADAASRNDGSRYPSLADEESKRLFISIGRNRRVFPREILGFINAKTQIPREDIGAIRILDNYSFVQVRDSAADTIIEALNGQTFRGRTLSVNYARARKDDGGENREPDFSEIPGAGDFPEPDEAEPVSYDRETGVSGDYDAEESAPCGGEETGSEETGFREPPETESSDQGDDHGDEENIEADPRQ
jgi:hypothetical protein